MERVVSYSLGEDFIAGLAEFIEKNYLRQGRDINRLAFVFGGKRPALFLKKELSRRIKRGFFPPCFFSMDEFVGYLLSKKEKFSPVSDLEASFIIYRLAQKIVPDILAGRNSFSQFLPWAREIANFIQQLDLENIENAALKNIQLKAALGYDVPENVNALLKGIISLRQEYHAALKDKHAYSRGLIYLFCAKHIPEIDLSEFDTIFFCGLFYLHKTEEDIIKNIYALKKAMLFFQGNAEDWLVLEDIAQKFSIPIEPPEDSKPRFNLSIQAGFDVHSEVCLAREIIKKINNLEETAIILPEPNNLIPLLSELSTYVKDFNISMGYPLKRSALYSLFEYIFKAQETKKGNAYYTRDYLRVLSHPLIKNLRVTDNPALTRVLIHKIEEILLGREKTPLGGSLFISLSDVYNSKELYHLAAETMKNMDIRTDWDALRKTVKELHQILFVCWEDISNFAEFSLNLEKFLDFLLRRSLLGNYPFNLKMAESIFSLIEELNNPSFREEPFPKEDIFRIFKHKLDNEMISFSGSPLKGLQILGLLETRSLSFENVVVMDVNEAVIPNLKIYEPLIPREVMISLGINRLEKDEEIQRYQFKRLLSSARNVYLVYQKSEDKEKSRFIEELIWEKQRELRALEVLPIPQAGFKVRVLPKRVEIKKKPEVIKFLRECEYSASSINTYLRCPLMFYYQYLLGLEEKRDFLDEPEGRDIGSFIHELFKDAFSRFVGKRPRIDEKFKKDFFVTLDRKFTDEFQNKMKSDAFLTKEVLDFRMEKFLENEGERQVKEILCLEKTFKDRIKLDGAFFKFQAIVDRIDRLLDDSILILDYKTGGSDIMPEGVEKIEAAGFSREALRDTVRSFQLPLYLYLVEHNKEYKGSRMNAALYFIRNLREDFGLVRLFKEEESGDKEKMMSVYLKALGSILGEIIDPAVPFKADESDIYQCSSCPFSCLCR